MEILILLILLIFLIISGAILITICRWIIWAYRFNMKLPKPKKQESKIDEVKEIPMYFRGV
jgi:hypothetical protein